VSEEKTLEETLTTMLAASLTIISPDNTDPKFEKLIQTVGNPGDRRVALTVFSNGHFISTVDLTRYIGYFETMLFHSDLDESGVYVMNARDHYCDRYDTREEAAQGHINTVVEYLAGTLETY
jgi:hypothetical protein